MPSFFRSSSALRLLCLSVLTLLFASPSWAAGSSTIVISQVYGGGGSSSATVTYNADYVELFNLSSSSVDISGYSVQYASATSVSKAATPFVIPAGVVLKPGQYYLIAAVAGVSPVMGANITPAPDQTYPSTSFAFSASAGKVFLVNTATALALGTDGCAAAGSGVVDFVGYGTTANCYEGTKYAPAPTSNQTSDVRLTPCVDTDQNSVDFTVDTTPVPHNSSSTLAPCGVTIPPVALSATAAFNPTSADTGSNTLLTATVTPGTTSTGITVTADLSALGGTTTTALHDDGQNGDLAAGDNIFSYQLTVPSNQAVASYTVNVTAKDLQSGSATAMATLGVTSPNTPVVPATTITLSTSTSTAVAGNSVTFTVVVSGNITGSTPGGPVTFYDGGALLGNGTSTIAGTYTYTTSALAIGAHTITATYGGDATYAASTVTVPASVAVNITAIPVADFTFSVSNSNIIANSNQKQAITMVNVGMINGYSSTVSFVCSGLPAGTRCIFSPATLSASGSSTLTIGIDGAHLHHNVPFSTGERTLAALGLLGLPLLLRRRKRFAGALLGLLMLGVTAFSLTGCTSSPSTPTGASTVTVTATGGSVTHTATFTLNVQ